MALQRHCSTDSTWDHWRRARAARAAQAGRVCGGAREWQGGAPLHRRPAAGWGPPRTAPPTPLPSAGGKPGGRPGVPRLRANTGRHEGATGGGGALHVRLEAAPPVQRALLTHSHRPVQGRALRRASCPRPQGGAQPSRNRHPSPSHTAGPTHRIVLGIGHAQQDGARRRAVQRGQRQAAAQRRGDVRAHGVAHLLQPGGQAVGGWARALVGARGGCASRSHGSRLGRRRQRITATMQRPAAAALRLGAQAARPPTAPTGASQPPPGSAG